MRINVAVPEAHVDRPVLDAALEATTRLNEAMLEAGEVPPFHEAVGRVRWKPEPPGQEHFDHAALVLGRGWGDCDDLAPWHAASLRVTGEDPDATAIVQRSGKKRWHAVVQRSDGSIDDPSRDAGMGQHGVGVLGAGLPLMSHAPRSEVGTYIIRPQLALRPVANRAGQIEAWQSRADLPWHWLPGRSPADIAMASLHASPTPDQAVVGACEGLAFLGEANEVDDDVIDRVNAIAALCAGEDWHDVADEYGEDNATAASAVVGSFFGSIAKGLKKGFKAATAPARALSHVVKYVPGVGPIAAKVMRDPIGFGLHHPELLTSFIPGAGLATSALKMASPALKSLLKSGRHLPAPHIARARHMPSYGTPFSQQSGRLPPNIHIHCR